MVKVHAPDCRIRTVITLMPHAEIDLSDAPSQASNFWPCIVLSMLFVENKFFFFFFFKAKKLMSAYRMTVHKVTGLTPNTAMLGKGFSPNLSDS